MCFFCEDRPQGPACRAEPRLWAEWSVHTVAVQTGPWAAWFALYLLHVMAQAGLSPLQPPGWAHLHAGGPGRPVHTLTAQAELSTLQLHGQGC